jgi:hypothetical protein
MSCSRVQARASTFCSRADPRASTRAHWRGGALGALGALWLVACAHAPQSYTVASLPADEVASEPVPAGQVVAPSAAPRVILPAPPPAVPLASSAPAPANQASGADAQAAPPSAESAPSAPLAPASATFTPSDSPLLAYYDKVPHGTDPPAQIDPLFFPRARGWTVRYRRPYYGYAPYSYGAYGYGGYGPGSGYYGYGYPSYFYPGVGFGVGLGLGWPYALGARHYGSGGYRSYGHHHGGGGHFGGHHGGHR